MRTKEVCFIPEKRPVKAHLALCEITTTPVNTISKHLTWEEYVNSDAPEGCPDYQKAYLQGLLSMATDCTEVEDLLRRLSKGRHTFVEKGNMILALKGVKAYKIGIVYPYKREYVTKKPWTVLLLLPDYVAGNYGRETYLAHVRATDTKDALKKARKQSAKALEIEEPDDLYCLFCTKGHVPDYSTVDGEVAQVFSQSKQRKVLEE